MEFTAKEIRKVTQESLDNILTSPEQEYIDEIEAKIIERAKLGETETSYTLQRGSTKFIIAYFKCRDFDVSTLGRTIYISW